VNGFEFVPHFIRPAWLLALPLAVLLPWMWRHLRRPSGDWARVVDPHLLRWLSVGETTRRGSGVGAWVAGAVLGLAVLALAGPSWQRLPDVSFAARDARVVVLDLSRSMLAEDLRPNRLTRARFRLSDLLQETSEGQVGLVTFAGDAYVVSPLTGDTNTIGNMLPALRPDVVPVAGSRADRGLALAAELLRRTGLGGGEILLVTDEARPRDADLAAELLEEGIVTSVLAVGTRGGAPIPSGNGFVTDARGNVVIARVDFEALRRVAEAGGGRMSQLDTGADPVSPWREDEGSDFALRDDALGDRWKDMGPWLLLGLLPLVALGFRRGLLFTVCLVLAPSLLAPVPAQAGFWDDLWQRRDQQAQEALRAEAPAEAAALAKDPRIAGEAWYRNGDYGQAADAWTATDQASAHYNRGNALALAGELDAAIAAYDEALARAPNMEDALYNKALVEQLKQQQEQESSGEDSEGEGEQEQGESEESESEGQDEQPSQEGEQEGESEPQQSEEGEGQEGQPREQEIEQAWTEEDAQAMEQWLRRIPDDPGGLLRRKFRNEHQRRGAPPDETKDW